ncbi:MAG: hypothetical protein F7B18_04865 [Desulfurococcales archaeon]|nr:hypothetical protein [Desulfurococcales archaeon]
MIGDARLLLLLPCNPGVRMGDYTLGQNWRVVLGVVDDLVGSGILDLAAIDSCKPGVVRWGEEHVYRWCDVRPLWHELYKREPWRLELLVAGVAEDLRSLALEYRALAAYVNVRAYRTALELAMARSGVKVHILGPPRLSPLSYRSRRSLEALRRGLMGLARATVTL